MILFDGGNLWWRWVLMRIVNDVRRRKKDVRSVVDINIDIIMRIVMMSYVIVDVDGLIFVYGVLGDVIMMILKMNIVGGWDEGIICWIEGKEMEEIGL